MKKILFASLFSLSLSACGTAPQMMAPPTTPMLRANQAPQFNANYSFRKPQGSITFRFDYGGQRTEGIEVFKSFMRKYVDKNDIFNYQTIEKSCSGDYCVTFNIFGGDKDFIKNSLFPDVRDYVRQRVETDHVSYHVN